MTQWRGWSLEAAPRAQLLATVEKCSAHQSGPTRESRCHRLRAVPIGARSSRSNRRGRLISVVHPVHEQVARREVHLCVAYSDDVDPFAGKTTWAVVAFVLSWGGLHAAPWGG